MSAPGLAHAVRLRDVTVEDIEILFRYQAEPAGVAMAVFPARGREAYFELWTRVLADPVGCKRAILVDGAVAGSVVSFVFRGDRLVGYWLGQAFWGRGVATRALREFLLVEPVRPLLARVATSNSASCRVLEKCGFRAVGEEFTPAVLAMPGVAERIYRLDAPAVPAP